MIPKLRFKADDGTEYLTWEEKTLGEVFTEIKEKNHSELPVLSVQQGVGTVLRDSSERRITYDKNNLKSYKAMKKGDFIIHLRSFEGGLECSNYDGISSPAYRILRPNMLLSDAFRDYFRSYAFIEGKLSESVVGIRDGKNIDMPTFWEIQIAVPSLPEQRKIAALLSSVDDVITAQAAEVAAWEERKKGVMQKLFSQEVRFKTGDGSGYPAWEEKTLGDICEYTLGGGTPSTKNESYYMGKTPWVSSSDLVNNDVRHISMTRFITDEAISKSATNRIPAGSVLVVLRVGVGKVALCDTEVCTSQDFLSLVNVNINRIFTAYLLSFRMQAEVNKTQGTSIKGSCIS